MVVGEIFGVCLARGGCAVFDEEEKRERKYICCRLTLILLCGKVTQDYRTVVCNYSMQKIKILSKIERS